MKLEGPIVNGIICFVLNQVHIIFTSTLQSYTICTGTKQWICKV